VYVAVGSNARIRALAGKNTRLVDLKGSTVIPGLSDSHDHLYAAEQVMRGISLVGATSTEEVLRRLKNGLARAKPGQTVLAASAGGPSSPRTISINSQRSFPSSRCAAVEARPY
jgi:predicted amidohydrolase YtcJ